MKRAPVGLFIVILFAYFSLAKTAQAADIDAETRARVSKWKSLIASSDGMSDRQKLKRVNDFVNEFKFTDDMLHWQKQDYWATPLQTLVTQGGDCEDLSIAKYFTLAAMGVDEGKLRLIYVKELPFNNAHMVLGYFELPDSEPILLDNINTRILASSHRQDLLTVFSFNRSGLWLAKQGRSEQYVDDPKRLKPWQRLLSYMDTEAVDEDSMICRYQYYGLAEKNAKQRCSITG